ncbi:hypothetical protein ANO11243_040180 [Dothideomycetidae sp. 11243]|nr:hypothetical protein ANO11243_040180 [fungal sp. No.11243]
MSELGDSMTGSCLCGSIQVTIRDNDLFTRPRGHLCHCANCRKVSGSYTSSSLTIEEDKVRIVDRDGMLKHPIKSESSTVAGKVVITMGMFPRIPKPEAEVFASRRQEWEGKHDGVTQYKTTMFEDKLDD